MRKKKKKLPIIASLSKEIWQPPKNTPPKKTLKWHERLEVEYYPIADTQEEYEIEPVHRAKCIVEHCRQWQRWGETINRNRIKPPKMVYSLQTLLDANKVCKEEITKNKKKYYKSMLSPTPFQEHEIAAIYCAIRFQGHPAGRAIPPVACANERFVLIANVEQEGEY